MYQKNYISRQDTVLSRVLCPVVSEEYSTEYKPGMEPYYPVNDDRNNALAEEYRRLAEKEENVIFGGRLAQYKYYDMAPVIEQVLFLFN